VLNERTDRELTQAVTSDSQQYASDGRVEFQPG